MVKTLVVLPARSSWILLCRIWTKVESDAARFVRGTGREDCDGEASVETAPGGKNDLLPALPPAEAGDAARCTVAACWNSRLR